jgi:hypothetical protein
MMLELTYDYRTTLLFSNIILHKVLGTSKLYNSKFKPEDVELLIPPDNSYNYF